MQDKLIKVCTAVILIALATGICLVVPMPEYGINTNEKTVVSEKNNTDAVKFSHTDYFYNDTIELELSSDKNIQHIFYTTDSTTPTSENGKEYTESLTLKGRSGSGVKSYTIKACGQYKDGSFTEVFTHSYFIGEEVDQRFDTIVFSLSTDPYNLYDDDYGIFTEGNIRKEYIKESGDRNPEPPAPANYNMRGIEWERPVYVEILDSEGNCLAAQNAGMRTFGGYSRAMEQKSIKLYARSEYDTANNDFDVDFFGDETDYNGMSIDSFKRIVLRNSANDNPFAFVRDETIQQCAEYTTLADTQNTKAAAVFLNGEYYGFAWIHQVYDEDYLDNHNEIDTDLLENSYWSVLSGGEHFKEFDEDNPNDVAASEEYSEMYDKYSYSDLTDDVIFNELCQKIDIENFLTYYAIQTYVANGDWPSGNYKVYRLSGEPIESELSPTADGKWRWLIYDTDFGLGLYGTSPSEKSLGMILGQHGNDETKRSDLLISILKRDDMRNKFVEILCDLMNHAYSPSSVYRSLKDKEAERMNELEWNFRVGGAQLKGTWSSLGRVSEEVQSIITFSIDRPMEMRRQIEKYLGVENSGWTVKVENNEDAEITVNSCNISDFNRSFEGFYFDINTVTISADIAIGKEFEHWLVNGNIITDEVLVLDNSYAENQNVKVELVTRDTEENIRPIITLIDYETGSDYIEISNPYISDINLKKFYISDSTDNLYYQRLPGYVLKSGETLRLYCENYSTIEALGGFSLGFNLKQGETLTISDANGICESIILPDISNDYILIKNMFSGKLYDCKRIALTSE